MRVAGARLHPYQVALPRSVRGHTTRSGWLLGLLGEAGQVGVGEAAPWPGFGASEAAVEADLARVCRALSAGGSARVGLAACRTSEACYALELALADLRGTLAWPLLAAIPHTILVSDPTDIGPHSAHLKVKVGPDLAREDARLLAIRRAAPAATLRLDANGAWSLAQARQALERFARHNIELIEQPTATLADMATLRGESSIPIAADELVTGPEAMEAVIAARAADIVVLKPMFVGGMAATRALASRAQAAGLDVIITHALESAVGRRGARILAAEIGGPYAHGVGGPDYSAAPESCVDPAPKAGPPVTWDPLMVPNPLGGQAAARRDHPALVVGKTSLSFGELTAQVRRRAEALRRLGVTGSDTVALLGPPTLDWVVSFHALGWLGACVAPVRQAADARLAGAHAMIVCEGAEGSPEAGLSETGSRSGVNRPHAAALPRLYLGDCATLPACEERPWGLLSPRVVVLSSGTTGTPRAVSLTTQQLLMSAFGSAIRLGHDPADRWLCCLPLNHIGGLSVLLRTAFYGTTAVLQPAFEPARVAAADATMISLVPAMLERLLDGPGLPKKTRVALIGGGPTRPALLARCAGLPIALTWGMTEAASQISTRTPGDLSPDGGVGFPLPFVRVRATDNGALSVLGPIAGGRLRSADRGWVDNRGRVFVSGRRDDMIVSGGENIDPSKLEAALRGHPAVADAAVAGVPSDRWGTRPAAWLVPSGAARPSVDTLRAHCQGRLLPFEIPDHFVWTDALPRTALGKLMRGRLRLSQSDLGASTGLPNNPLES